MYEVIVDKSERNQRITPGGTLNFTYAPATIFGDGNATLLNKFMVLHAGAPRGNSTEHAGARLACCTIDANVVKSFAAQIYIAIAGFTAFSFIIILALCIFCCPDTLDRIRQMGNKVAPTETGGMDEE